MFVNSFLRSSCLLTQPKNFKRIMSCDSGWITPRIMKRLVDISVSKEQKFGKNLLGRAHWDEISYIRELCICNSELFTLQLKGTPKIPISKLRRENSMNELHKYPTYVLIHSTDDKNKCKIEKLYSYGDDGIFSNDRPCVLLLKDKHFYNVWDTIFCLMMWICQRLVIRENAVAHLVIRNHFVCIVWFRIQTIIYMFVAAGVIAAWI